MAARLLKSPNPVLAARLGRSSVMLNAWTSLPILTTAALVATPVLLQPMARLSVALAPAGLSATAALPIAAANAQISRARPIIAAPAAIAVRAAPVQAAPVSRLYSPAIYLHQVVWR